MVSGWIFLGITTLICIGAFLNGVRFSRMTSDIFDKKGLFGLQVEGFEMSLENLRRFGRLQMIFAPLFLFIVALMVFGFFGPVDGIQTIKFN